MYIYIYIYMCTAFVFFRMHMCKKMCVSRIHIGKKDRQMALWSGTIWFPSQATGCNSQPPRWVLITSYALVGGNSLQDGGIAVCRMVLEGCSCKLARSISGRGRRIYFCIGTR